MAIKDIQVRKRPLHKDKISQESFKTRWWLEDEEHVFQVIGNVINNIDMRQRAFWQQSLMYAGLYENIAKIVGSTYQLGASGNMARTQNPVDGFNWGNKLTYNVVKSCVDSATAKIAKEEPKVEFVTTEADWNAQRRAKLLTTYTDGLFYEAEVHEQTVQMFKDSTVLGTGVVKVFIEPGTTDIKVERVICTELTIDDADSVYGTPRQLHQKRQAARDTVMEMYPEFKDKIAVCPAIPYLSRNAVDDILVSESWHLPSGPKAKDGRHIVCINNCTLEYEDYTKKYFPFVFYRWGTKTAGIWGTGLSEELAGIQTKINKLVKQINLAQELMCIPRVMVEEGSNIATHKLWDFGVIKYRGQPPVFNTAPAMPPEIYQSLENEIQRAYQITGISQLSAQSQKPAGLNSGVALREYQDINTERFATQAKAFSQAHIKIARIMIDLSRDLYEDNKDLSVIGRVKGSKFIKKIRWDKVDLAEDKFIMRAFPVSQLPATPEGRLQMIQELTQAGFLSHEQATELLQIPDIENALSDLNAAYDTAAMIIDNILSEGDYTVPSPFMNLELTTKLAQSMYLRAQVNGLEKEHPERLDMLRVFMEQCQVLMEPPPPPAEPGLPAGAAPPQLTAGSAGAGTPMAPIAGPMKAPGSDLLPFAQPRKMEAPMVQ
jgi:hypothetical protein